MSCACWARVEAITVTNVAFERTRDYGLVRSIITHPAVFRATLLSDGTPAREEFVVPEDEGIWYVIAKEAGAPIGLYVFRPLNAFESSVHMALLPCAWGKRSRAVSLACAAWYAGQSGCELLAATVPAYNRLMHSLARRIGMTETAILPDSIRQRGQLCDQTIFTLRIQNHGSLLL